MSKKEFRCSCVPLTPIVSHDLCPGCHNPICEGKTCAECHYPDLHACVLQGNMCIYCGTGRTERVDA